MLSSLGPAQEDKCLLNRLPFSSSRNYFFHFEKMLLLLDLKSIFFGGGTPSLIESSVIKKIIKKCVEKFKYVSLSNEAEITLEANPNSLTKSKLLSFRDA